jgi:hypothetical protein
MGKTSIQNFGEKYLGKQPLRRLRKRWEDNIKMILKK